MTHRELIEELVQALEDGLAYIDGTIKAHWGESDRQAINRVRAELVVSGYALINKAKVLEDCVPEEDAAEVAASQERWQ